MTDASEKIALRKVLIKRRNAIDPEARLAAAEKAARLLAVSPIFRESEHIACYLARDEEFDCVPIIEKVWRAQKKCYVPVLSPHEENTLEFVSYHHDDILEFNRYKILEPTDKEKVSIDKIDLVIMPLVGFDLQGNRLGMGGGYYDRTFSKKKTFLLGLAYDAQEVPTLPSDVWDIPLNGILTEKRIILF
jgi:5-formyltetrahydrofolate cyclo-ligase